LRGALLRLGRGDDRLLEQRLEIEIGDVGDAPRLCFTGGIGACRASTHRYEVQG